MIPKYLNSLQGCIFLGAFYLGRHFDLYLKKDENQNSLVARFGSRPFEYYVAAAFSMNKPAHLAEAEARAIEKGLLKPSPDFPQQSSR